jgi:RNA polymerase sigma factor (sigma-70 family)
VFKNEITTDSFIETASPTSERIDADALETYIRKASRAFMTGTGADADDFAQEARLRVFLAHRGRENRSQPYLKLTAKNAMRDYYGDETRYQQHYFYRAEKELEFSDGTSEGSFANEVVRRITVRNWVDHLPPILQTVYQLIYESGYTQREAAVILKLSQPRVAQLHSELLGLGRRDLNDLNC